MKFYRANRVDGEFEQDLTELASMFWQSPEAQDVLRGTRLDRSLRLYLTNPHGFNSSWDDRVGYEELFQLVRDRWPSEGTAEAQKIARMRKEGDDGKF